MGGTLFNCVNQNPFQQLPLKREWSFVLIRVPETACSWNNQCSPPLPNNFGIKKIAFAVNCSRSTHDTECCPCQKKNGTFYKLRVELCNRNASGFDNQFTAKAINCFKSGFLNLSPIDILYWKFFVVRAVLCIVGRLEAFMASTHYRCQ